MKRLTYILALLLGSLGVMAQTNQPLPAGSKPLSNILYLAPDSTVWTGDEFNGLFVKVAKWNSVDSLFKLGYTKGQVDSAITANAYTAGQGLQLVGREFRPIYGTAANTVAQGNDSRIVNAVPNTRTINGLALTGNINLNASHVGALAITGGTLSGNLSMGNNRITSVGSPTTGPDAANKNYVDNAITDAMSNIPGGFSVANSSGTNQFTVNPSGQIRFQGGGGTTVSFSSATNSVVVSSSGGGGGTQSLSLGSGPGEISISDGNTVSLASLERNVVSSDFSAWSQSRGRGLYPFNSGTGSTGLPYEQGAGLLIKRQTDNSLDGSLSIFTGYNSENTAYLMVGNGTTGWHPGEIIATRPWVSSQIPTISISAGNGMNFSTITGTGAVTLGTPSTLSGTTTNAVTSTSHTHALDQAVFTGIGNLSTSDLNTIGAAGSGFAYQGTLSDATSERNYPVSGGGGSLLNFGAGSVASYRTQFFHNRTGARMFYRVYTGTGWSSWNELWHSGNLTGAATTITSSDLTANRALVSNASGKVAISATTSTELGYLSGVTSNLQTQLNGTVKTTGDQTVTGSKTWTGLNTFTSPITYNRTDATGGTIVMDKGGIGTPFRLTVSNTGSGGSNLQFNGASSYDFSNIITTPSHGSSSDWYNPAWSRLTGVPSTFAPSAHTHNASDINAGTLAIARIPTGTTGSTVALGNHTHTFSAITSKPTTLSGYGITDAVPSSRTINGKALSSNVTLTASDLSAMPTSWTITAGNGLTGGGNGTANRSLAVGAGDGITVNTTNVAVDGTVVRTSGNQTLAGTKTFSSPVIVPNGTASNHAVNLSQITGSGSLILGTEPNKVKTNYQNDTTYVRKSDIIPLTASMSVPGNTIAAESSISQTFGVSGVTANDVVVVNIDGPAALLGKASAINGGVNVWLVNPTSSPMSGYSTINLKIVVIKYQ